MKEKIISAFLDTLNNNELLILKRILDKKFYQNKE